MIDVAYVRGSQLRLIILPDMLQKAPFFNRIKMWRKFKGRAVFGTSGALGAPIRGQSLAIINKSRQRRLQVEGLQPGAGGGPIGVGRGGPPSMMGGGMTSRGPPLSRS